MTKYYVIVETEYHGDFSDAFNHVCISPYEDDCADAICWMNDDLGIDEAERLAKIMCEALNKDAEISN